MSGKDINSKQVIVSGASMVSKCTDKAVGRASKALIWHHEHRWSGENVSSTEGVVGALVAPTKW